MKRTKLLSILALLLIVVLISLSFIKLPISTLTNERIQSETQGYISFHGAEAQSLLLLPTPKIELLDSFFSITHPSIKLDIFSSYTELSKSLFNDENIHITSSKTTLENIETDLFNNSVLLEDVIENLKIEILSEKEFTEVKSNNFIYKGKIKAPAGEDNKDWVEREQLLFKSTGINSKLSNSSNNGEA